MSSESSPFKRNLLKLRLFHIINHLLLCATAAGLSTKEAIMSYSESRLGELVHAAPLQNNVITQEANLNLK